ncbi:hypothetical protein ACFYO1_32795 [Nocardia sp. NPDC006044]|uniref:hypothetical protein n=1 Tax=Nocardia sp. NPDC006044 TaxID=3364306 RepID=UPI0036B13BD2
MAAETDPSHGDLDQDETVWVEDASYRANGALVIPSDDADVDPVPLGTPLGNIEETADAYGPIHDTMVRLNSNPAERAATLDAMMAHWDPEAANERIKARVKARIAAKRQAEKSVLGNVKEWVRAHPVASSWL